MSNDIINIGIVGPGRVAKRLAQAVSELQEFNLWSICSRSIETAKKFADAYGAIAKINAHNSFQNMMTDPDLHAVIIATPDKFHISYATEALSNGKHVFIEKPLCTTIEEGRQLLDQATKTNCVVAVGYHLRWHPGLRLLAEKVHSDGFGKIHHISINWAHTFIKEASWRNSPELSRWWSISTLGTHCLDIIRWLMLPGCGEVTNINFITTNKKFGLNDESVIISLEFESGATASIFTSVLFDSPFQLDVYGEKNKATAVNVTGSKEKGALLLNGLPLAYPFPGNLYASELKNFSDAINYKNDVEVSLIEGFRNIELLARFIN